MLLGLNNLFLTKKQEIALLILGFIYNLDTFRVYDLNGDGYISREEMFQLLKHCLIKQPAEEDPDEGIKELVEITLKKMVRNNFIKQLVIIKNISLLTLKFQDVDHDSRLSLADFTASVFSEELLLEAFGKCLPDEELAKFG